jgi:predicted metal-dependent peptidase
MSKTKTTTKSKSRFKREKDPNRVLPDQKLIEEKLTTARIALLIKQPFFGSMATRLTLVRDDNFKTAATDGRHFYYNLEFIADLSVRETEFLFGHEVLHNVFEHHIRAEFPDGQDVANEDGTVSRKCRYHLLWNIACDYAVNEILVDSRIGDRIEHTLYDEKYKGKCAEEIYDELKKNMKTIDLEGLADMLLDEHLEDLEKQGKKLSEAEKQKIRNEIRESLLNSAQTAGSVPMGVDRMIKSLTAPTLSWKELLRMDIQSTIKHDYTFYTPSKKGMQYGVVLPGMKRDEALDVCIAIDTSGSIDNHTLSVFLSEITGIMDQYDDYQIRIWSFDAEVHNEQIFRSDEGTDITTYQPAGGGGTLFEANWDYMKKNDINPKVFIMFTDMCPGGGWGDPAYCDHVIFVGYQSNGKQAPFGTTITMPAVGS